MTENIWRNIISLLMRLVVRDDNYMDKRLSLLNEESLDYGISRGQERRQFIQFCSN